MTDGLWKVFTGRFSSSLWPDHLHRDVRNPLSCPRVGSHSTFSLNRGCSPRHAIYRRVLEGFESEKKCLNDFSSNLDGDQRLMLQAIAYDVHNHIAASMTSVENCNDQPNSSEKQQQERLGNEGLFAEDNPLNRLDDDWTCACPSINRIYFLLVYLHADLSANACEATCYLSPSTSVAVFVYIRRMIASGVTLTPSNWRRLMVTVVLIGAKVWEDDQVIWNSDVQKLIFDNISPTDMLSMELDVLSSLRWDTSVNASDFTEFNDKCIVQYVRHLRRAQA